MRAVWEYGQKILDQFPVALDVFVRGLRAGHPVAAALDLLTVDRSECHDLAAEETGGLGGLLARLHDVLVGVEGERDAVGR